MLGLLADLISGLRLSNTKVVGTLMTHIMKCITPVSDVTTSSKLRYTMNVLVQNTITELISIFSGPVHHHQHLGDSIQVVKSVGLLHAVVTVLAVDPSARHVVVTIILREKTTDGSETTIAAIVTVTGPEVQKIEIGK